MCPTLAVVKKAATVQRLGSEVAGATGLEPAASAVTGQRSNQLSYAPAGVGQDLKAPLPQVKDKSGTPGNATQLCEKRPIFRKNRWSNRFRIVYSGKQSGVRPGSRISRGGSHHGYSSW